MANTSMQWYHKEGCIQQDWISNVVLLIHKGKVDHMEWGSYTEG